MMKGIAIGLAFGVAVVALDRCAHGAEQRRFYDATGAAASAPRRPTAKAPRRSTTRVAGWPGKPHKLTAAGNNYVEQGESHGYVGDKARLLSSAPSRIKRHN
jgi:hypothetical protein